ncbi:TolC family protein [Geotalea uraniireducens]|uniref:Outer membrane efflux protein n=1 Tax=Geotalea uraniireducens (strain Rf4) TaxID=351605 RepID=A5G6V1_GEOUR|nr:TolC family protein [Geotalea uraniireducens]ABQ27519.1 outer membrane efflux protein [Geotalea uraniireducens Rf4]
MVRTISVTGAVLLLQAVCSLSGESSALAGEKNFTLQQAVEFAQQNNGELKALREEKGIREAGKIKAGLYPNPVLDLDGTTGELSGSPSENLISVGISQEFLTMGKRGKRLAVADKEIESFDRQVDNSGRLLVEEVKTTFYDLLLAGKRVELAERSIALNNQLLEVTKQRLEAGDIPELEVNLARVEVARSEGKKVEAERGLYPAKARLLALTGLPPNEEARFIGSLEAKPLAKNLGELKSWALAKRPDIMGLEAEKAKGDAEIALAQAERIPNITAGFGYQRENTAIEVAGSDVKDRDNLIGLKLSIPIPLFDRNQAGIREAQARKGSAENRYAFARVTAEREVEAAFARLATAEKSLSIYTREIIPQLEENLKLVQEAYRLGEVGILTVIEEQKKFFEVNDGYLTALHDRQTALVKLETAVAIDLTGGAQ